MRRPSRLSLHADVPSPSPSPVLVLKVSIDVLHNNQVIARALIDQSVMVYVMFVPVNSWKNRAYSELLSKSNRPQVSMVYRLTNYLGWARDLRILRLFY